MAIKEFWGIDGLPAILGSSAVVTYLRSDMVLRDNYSGSIVKTGTGWLNGIGATIAYPAANYGNYNPAFGVPYQNVSDFTTRRSFIGFRHNINNITAGSNLTPILRLTNTAGTVQNIIMNNQLALNLNQYIEVMFDRVNKLIVVWLDGVQLSSTFFDFSAFVAADGNAFLWFGAATNINVLYQWLMRDFYFLDDTQDATQCNRLGSVDIRQSLPASISAPNWISSDSGTPLSDLTTILGTTAATQTLPTQTEPSTMDPMTVGFSNANVVNGEKILAFRADVTAQRTAGYTFSPAVKVALGAQSVNGKPLIYPNGNAMIYNQNAFLQETAPDGSAWTPSSIQNAVMTLTP